MKIDKKQIVLVALSIFIVLTMIISVFWLPPGWGNQATMQVAEQLAETEIAPKTSNVTEVVDDSKQGATSSGIAEKWIAGLSALVALVSIGLAVTAIRWRKALDGGQSSILPTIVLDKWKDVAKSLNKQDSSLKDFSGVVAKNLNNASAAQNETQKHYKDILDTLHVFQKELTKREQEIDRLKRGGDAEVFRKFLDRFLRLYRNMSADLEELKEKGEGSKLLESQLELLEDALLETGLERFCPKLDSDYKTADGVADKPATIDTDDPKLDYKIAKVLNEGFLLRTPDKPQYVQKATVKIFKYNKEES